ncbi:hypothetical protein F2P81_021532 [Scophthalmus maximus]|uniref:Uncharacterized protein n=1 Tax=Scophthalmus maximus TaxID=52904 RepID=A0A6A4S3I4_SCOMX|nr:hypothetical protein F2P81_021532 [Scophthalmus maximus]
MLMRETTSRIEACLTQRLSRSQVKTLEEAADVRSNAHVYVFRAADFDCETRFLKKKIKIYEQTVWSHIDEVIIRKQFSRRADK